MSLRTEFQLLRAEIGFQPGSASPEVNNDDWKFGVDYSTQSGRLFSMCRCYLESESGFAQALGFAVTTDFGLTEESEVKAFFEIHIREQLYDLIRRSVTSMAALADIHLDLSTSCPDDIEFEFVRLEDDRE